MQKQPEALKVGRNLGIDLLRVLSILYIVCYWHLLEYLYGNPCYNIVTIRITNIILGTFVFISGYFIGLKNVPIDKKSLIKFYRERFLRVYPLYIAAIVACLMCHYIDLLTSVKSILLISMFVKPAALTLWFITMIMTFYVLSPFLVYCVYSGRYAKVLLISLVSCAILVIYYFLTKNIDIRIIVFYPAFLLGIMISNNSCDVYYKNKYIFIILFLIAVLLSFIPTHHYGAFLLLSTPMVTLGAYITFILFNKTTPYLSKYYKIILLLSYSSYCIYLFHRPVFIWLINLYFPTTYYAKLLYLLFFCVPLIILISYFIQNSYDALISMMRRGPRPPLFIRTPGN